MHKISPNDLVSIIVLNHNGEKFIEKCLTSIEKLSYKNKEVIVVDNASTDKSRSIIESFPQFKHVYNKIGLGFAGGNNAGIKVAKGKYILLISNDTWVKKDFLDALVTAYNRLEYDVLAPREASYEGIPNPLYTTTIDPLGHNVFRKNVKKNISPFYVTGVCLLFPADVYNSTRGLDSDFFLYCEDVDWFWRLQLLGITFGYADGVFINHKGAGSTGGSSKKHINYQVFLWRNQNTLQMLFKNYAWYNLCWVIPLYLLQNILEMLFFILLLKPSIAYTYILGWEYNIKLLSSIIKKRKWIQKNRKVTDRIIMQRMYHGSGKIYHLLQFYFS